MRCKEQYLFYKLVNFYLIRYTIFVYGHCFKSDYRSLF